MSHTPGPWTWENDKEGWLNAGDEPVLQYAGCGSHGCWAVDDDKRLIAAAPDLLEALQGWIWARENGASEELAEQYARAAIARATGETA